MTAQADSFVDVCGEFGLENDVIVQGVLEILRAPTPSMAVVDAKDLQFGPELVRNGRLLLLGLDHIENY